MILGAGETSELTARALADQGAGTIFVANRHADRALSLAAALRRLGGRARRAARAAAGGGHRALLDLLAAPDRRARGARAGDARSASGRPLLLIDIAVPRDIDPRCARARGGHAVRHRRPAGGRRAQPRARARARCRARRRSSRRRSTASRAGSASSTTLPTVSALREHGNDARRAGARRERRALGVGLAARPRPRRGDRAGGA